MWFGSIYPYMSFFEFAEMEPAYSRIEPLIGKLIAECYDDLATRLEFSDELAAEIWNGQLETWGWT